MQKLFFDFIQSPTRESYLAIRGALLSSEAYDPYSDELKTVTESLDGGRREEAIEALAAAMPNLVLSPRAHLILSYIAAESGHEEESNMEGYIAATCCEGILSTGDGTQDSPFLVVRTSDEHDLLQYLEKTFTGQSLREMEGRHYDVLTCSDGSEFWFDISDAFGQLDKRFGDRLE